MRYHGRHMAIFAIIKQPGSADNVGFAVHSQYPALHYDLGADAWLVAAQSTAQDVSEKLGITSGINGSAIIVEVASYFGRANPAIWTWIKANWEGAPIV